MSGDTSHLKKGDMMGDRIQISLKAARANADMTQAEAARYMNVTVNTIVNWESNKTVPSVVEAKKLARIYGISIENIFFPDDKI